MGLITPLGFFGNYFYFLFCANLFFCLISFLRYAIFGVAVGYKGIGGLPIGVDIDGLCHERVRYGDESATSGAHLLPLFPLPRHDIHIRCCFHLHNVCLSPFFFKTR